MPKPKIDIPSFSDEGGHTRYKLVTVRGGAAEVVTYHRFSEFHKLHTALALATYVVRGPRAARLSCTRRAHLKALP